MLWLVTASRRSSTPTRASQFTGAAFTGVLANNGIAISMDGKGAWRDNVFVERLWRSVKYEEVYLRAYDSVSEAAEVPLIDAEFLFRQPGPVQCTPPLIGCALTMI